jgi:hypothetical protein
MKGRKDELSSILFKTMDAAKSENSDNFLGYWTFRVGYWIFIIFIFLCIYPLKTKTNHIGKDKDNY